MLIACGPDEVLYTDAIAGLPANFLKPSIAANGLDPADLPKPLGLFRPDLPEGVRPWRSVWSAGHSVGQIDDAPPVAEVVERLAEAFERHAPDAGWRVRLQRALGPLAAA